MTCGSHRASSRFTPSKRGYRCHAHLAQALGHLDTDEFEEELPYRETHGYAKQVLQAWGTYCYLYGPPGDPEYRRLPLPRRARPP